MYENLKQWDRDIFIAINSAGLEGMDTFWTIVTKTYTWFPLFLFFFLLILHFYKRKKATIVLFYLLLATSVTVLFTGVVKEIVARLRPNNSEYFGDLIRILQTPLNYSFFSGHAASSFVITTFVVLVLRRFTKWIYLAYIWPILFVSSRIFVGVHYPSDIFVGAVVGTSFAYVFYILCEKTLKSKSLLYSGDSESISDGE